MMVYNGSINKINGLMVMSNTLTHISPNINFGKVYHKRYSLYDGIKRNKKSILKFTIWCLVIAISGIITVEYVNYVINSTIHSVRIVPYGFGSIIKL